MFGPYIPYGLFQTKGCAKFGSDWCRNVNLCKVQTNKQTLSFMYKIIDCHSYCQYKCLYISPIWNFISSSLFIIMFHKLQINKMFYCSISKLFFTVVWESTVSCPSVIKELWKFSIKSFSQHTFICLIIISAWYNYQTNKGVLTEWFYTKLLQHIGMNNYQTLKMFRNDLSWCDFFCITSFVSLLLYHFFRVTSFVSLSPPLRMTCFSCCTVCCCVQCLWIARLTSSDLHIASVQLHLT